MNQFYRVSIDLDKQKPEHFEGIDIQNRNSILSLAYDFFRKLNIEYVHGSYWPGQPLVYFVRIKNPLEMPGVRKWADTMEEITPDFDFKGDMIAAHFIAKYHPELIEA